MQLTGSAGQIKRLPLYDASGTLAAGGTPQLILPEGTSRSFLLIANNSDTAMYLEFGSARATCTISNGSVDSITIENAGFGFTVPPIVNFYGGANNGWNINDPGFTGCGLVGYPSPGKPAVAHCEITGGVVTNIVIDDGGSGYVVAPQIVITNSLRDPFGCAAPNSSTGVGIPIFANGGSYYVNGTTCPTDSISLVCASPSKKFTCKWMP